MRVLLTLSALFLIIMPVFAEEEYEIGGWVTLYKLYDIGFEFEPYDGLEPLALMDIEQPALLGEHTAMHALFAAKDLSTNVKFVCAYEPYDSADEHGFEQFIPGMIADLRTKFLGAAITEFSADDLCNIYTMRAYNIAFSHGEQATEIMLIDMPERGVYAMIYDYPVGTPLKDVRRVMECLYSYEYRTE